MPNLSDNIATLNLKLSFTNNLKNKNVFSNSEIPVFIIMKWRSKRPKNVSSLNVIYSL